MSMVTRLWNSTQHYRRAFVALRGPGRMWVVNAEHRLILDAIERRDPTDAERYLSGHIRRTADRARQAPGGRFRVKQTDTDLTVNGAQVDGRQPTPTPRC